MADIEQKGPVEDTAKRTVLALQNYGFVASAIWLTICVAYASFEWDHLLMMKPHDAATFLSGVFAPLAFLWLVLGFMQQGEELRNSADALRLQGEELRNSVEQQRELVEVTREQVAALRHDSERENNPFLLLDFGYRDVLKTARERAASPRGGQTKRISEMVLKNRGSDCTELKIVAGGELVRQTSSLATDAEYRWQLPKCEGPIDVLVGYTNRVGQRRAQLFQMPVHLGQDGHPHFTTPVKIPGILAYDS